MFARREPQGARLDRPDRLQTDRSGAVEARDPVPEHATRIHDRIDEALQDDLERIGDLREQAEGVDDRLGRKLRDRPQQQSSERAEEDDAHRDDAQHEVGARGESDHSY